jgi:UDP-glucose-4-epimerase GalE
MKAIVTGGAGYIGSHVVRALVAAGWQVLVVDDLSSGHADDVRGVPLERADVTAPGVLDGLQRDFGAEAILHFAARIAVGESMAQPQSYFATNVGGMLRVIETASRARVPVVFSSTAAVYGEPEQTPIPVEHRLAPENPYGRSKLIGEQMLADAARAHGFGWMALRYFNAAGADVAAGLGEKHDPETHLIPLAIDAARGTRPPLELFGADWPTRDGTCVRDYIHVIDLADAHLRALEKLRAGAPSGALNLGTGEGASVREVLAAVERAVGRPVPHTIAPRRAGDVATLVADPSRAHEALGWRATRSLDRIVADAAAARRA